MDRTQIFEEALSVIWEEREEKKFSKDVIRKKIMDKVHSDILEELEKEGKVKFEDNAVKLTKSGEDIARDIVRRQRLAERLLKDVLDVGRQEMDAAACKFEHVISKEVEENICALLGHPKECPHGHPIPPGACCGKTNGALQSIVIPLSQLAPGQTGRIVYVLTHEHPMLHKIMSFGIVPGVKVLVHQTFPSFIIQVEQTQLALEKELADEIYVRRKNT